jgi:hypothetical protein
LDGLYTDVGVNEVVAFVERDGVVNDLLEFERVFGLTLARSHEMDELFYVVLGEELLVRRLVLVL